MKKNILKSVLAICTLIFAACTNKQKQNTDLTSSLEKQNNEAVQEKNVTPQDDRIYIKFLYEKNYGLLDSKLNIIEKNNYRDIFLINDNIFFLDANEVRITDLDLKPKAEVKMNADNKIMNIFYLIDDFYCLKMFDTNDIVYNMKSGESVSYGQLDSNHSNKSTSFLQPVWTRGYYVSLLDGKQYFNDRNYEKTFQFSNGLAAVLKEDWSKALINEDGTIILDDVVNCGKAFTNGLMPVITEKTSGYINGNGEFVFNCDLVDEDWRTNVSGRPTLRGSFTEDYAYVHTKDNCWTIMAMDGTIIKDNIPYETRSDGFSCGLINVYSNGKSGYANRSGELAIPMVFDSSEDFSNGYAMVIYQGENGILDTNGNVYLCKDLLSGNKKPFVNVTDIQ